MEYAKNIIGVLLSAKKSTGIVAAVSATVDGIDEVSAETDEQEAAMVGEVEESVPQLINE